MDKGELYRREFGKKLRDLRRLMGLTQQDLAEALNVSSQAVSKWERGKAFPNMSKMPTIAKLLGAEVSDLLDFGKTG